MMDISRRGMIGLGLSGAAMAAMPFAASADARPSMQSLVDDWRDAWTRWTDAAMQEGGGNFDTPDCLYWESEHQRILGLLKSCPIATTADAVALSSFIQLDIRQTNNDDDSQSQVERWALERLLTWVARFA